MTKKSIFGFLRPKKKTATKSQRKQQAIEGVKAQAIDGVKPQATITNAGKNETGKVRRKPRRQIPNRQIPPDGPRNLRSLPPELLLYITEGFLDQVSSVALSLSCKLLYGTVPRETGFLTKDQKLHLLTLFPPRYSSLDTHPHPYLCTDCLKYHSLRCTSLWPSWAPENTFPSFHDFASQPRVCVTSKISSGRWGYRFFVEGNKDFLLCEKCVGLYSTVYKRCSWNCENCGKCAGRHGWSALCRECTRVRGSVKAMRYRGSASEPRASRASQSSQGKGDKGRDGDGAMAKRTYSGRIYSYVGSSIESPTSGQPEYTPKRSESGPKGTRCPMCLGWRAWDPHSVETCRCFGSERDQLPGNTRMMYDGY